MMVKTRNYHARKSQAYKNPIVTCVECLKSVKHGPMVAKKMHEIQDIEKQELKALTLRDKIFLHL